VSKRPIDGVLLLDKPAGMSSNAALQKVRRTLQAAKAGHTGTLDPMATGLLPLCFGEATKFASALLEADKTYLATLRLGIVTTTADAEGEILATQPVTVTQQDVLRVLDGFIGEIDQVPPMYSALKRAGTPLYALARRGIEVERSARRVTIRALRLTAWEGERFEIEVTCSKGAYIRTLAADIGAVLGCGAHLAALRRTRVGRLDVAAALPLATLDNLDASALTRLLLPVDSLLEDLPVATLSAAESARVLQGRAVRWTGAPGRLFRLIAPQGFLGVGLLAEDGWLKPQRLIATQ
jgi:tRNA pseudouridine55 synthase